MRYDSTYVEINKIIEERRDIIRLTYNDLPQKLKYLNDNFKYPISQKLMYFSDLYEKEKISAFEYDLLKKYIRYELEKRALEQNGNNIQYIKEPNEFLKIIAISNGCNYEYIKYPTYEMKLLYLSLN